MIGAAIAGVGEDRGVIPELYQKIYGAPCQSQTEILLTYKGQFVASARRLRGVPKSVYVEMLERLERGNGTSGGRETKGGEWWVMIGWIIRILGLR